MKEPRREITLRIGQSVVIAPGVRVCLFPPRPGRDDPAQGVRLGITADPAVVIRRPELGEWRPERKGGAA